MPDISVTDEQLAAIDAVRDALADRAGEYAHVRRRDAVQYLIDAHRGDLEADPLEGATASANGSVGATADANAASESEPAGDDGDTTASSDDEGSQSDGDSAGGSDGDGDGDDRLNAMMQLLETHADKWGEADADDARYAVTLPDGSEEQVQTKDDVRALLFKNYER